MSLPEAPVGSALPELVFIPDRTTIVAAAIASQDFEDVHHDPGKARGRGMPDIFMSINSTNGFVDRYVTDWSGPATRIIAVSLRLGVPLFAGDTLRFNGEVTERRDDEVDLRVVGRNDRGVHVSAQVTVAAQDGASP
jgi:acyl dehydratase